MGATFSPTLAGLGGTISEVQHGAQTGPANAHEYADLSGVPATDAAPAIGSLRTLGAGAQQAAAGDHVTDHAGLTGVSADQHHKRTEAKATAGSAGAESVAWTTAFATVPIVTGSSEYTFGGAFSYPVDVIARSTTGATVISREVASTLFARVKMVSAQEAT